MTVVAYAAAILLGVVFLLLVGFAIPCILEIRRAAKDMALTLRIVNENLPAIMKNLEVMTTNVSRTTATINRQFDDLSLIVHKMKEMMMLVVGLEEVIRRGAHLSFVPTLRTALAVSKGVRVFLSHLRSESRNGA